MPSVPTRSLCLVAGLAAGCAGGPTAVPVPKYSPDAAAQEAIKLYDRNGDGALSGTELDACPSVKSAAAALGASDGRVTADRLRERLKQYESSGIGAMSVSVTVSLDGRPLSGATVRFVPEPFLAASGVKPSVGTTDETGRASVEAEGGDPPGVPPGFYKVEVSKKDASGRETVPAKFNSPTTLGEEVGPNTAAARGGVELRLASS